MVIETRALENDHLYALYLSNNYCGEHIYKLTTLIVNIFERKGIFKSLNQII